MEYKIGKIKKLIKSKFRTQKAFAAHAGIDPNELSKYLVGTRKIGKDGVKIANGLGLSIREIVDMQTMTALDFIRDTVENFHEVPVESTRDLETIMNLAVRFGILKEGSEEEEHSEGMTAKEMFEKAAKEFEDEANKVQ